MNSSHYDNTKLAAWREETGLSQKTVAERLDVARNTISRAEIGEVASYDLLCQLAYFYNKPIKDLLYAQKLAA